MTKSTFQLWTELCRERELARFGIRNPQRLARVQREWEAACDEAARTRTEEEEILARFNNRHLGLPMEPGVLNHMGIDEFVDGPWIVDESSANRCRRVR